MTIPMTCEIVFQQLGRSKNIKVTQVTEIVVDSSWKNLTTTCEITLPRKIKFFDKNKVRDLFRRGDYVTVAYGYENQNVQEFRGYITEVAADIPITIRLQDEMWKLKQMPVNFSSPNISLDGLLKAIAPGYKIDALEGVTIGNVRFPKTTVATVLKKLSEDPWKLYTYFKILNNQPVLVCGKYYADDSKLPKINFDLEKNVVSTSLNYVRKEDLFILIKGVSTFINGTKIDFEFGDKDGQNRELTYYNKAMPELQKLVKLDYDKFKVDRFDGSFTGFGIPVAKHGQKANVTSTLYPDRNGLYYIEGVTKRFSKDGIRQEIKLGEKTT